ncbi:uncharacterized protein ACMZJ9_009450 [Mantella aurantiaca]
MTCGWGDPGVEGSRSSVRKEVGAIEEHKITPDEEDDITGAASGPPGDTRGSNPDIIVPDPGGIADNTANGRENVVMEEIREDIYEQLCMVNGGRWSLDDIEEAVSLCLDYISALQYLSHECILCDNQYPYSKIVKLIHCNCSLCEQCFIRHFTSVINENSIIHVVCPLCNKPELEENGNSDESMEYFNLLDTQIRHYLDKATHDLFQIKLRDRALMEIPEFDWNNQPLEDKQIIYEHLCEVNNGFWSQEDIHQAVIACADYTSAFQYLSQKHPAFPDPIQNSKEIKQEIYEQLCMENKGCWSLEDIAEAVSSCPDYRSALQYLSHECPLCDHQYPYSKIVKLIHCNCYLCEQCFIRHFTSVINEKSIIHVVCPLCNIPELEENGNSDESMEYFNLLDTQIRHYLDQATHDLFQIKLRDRALMEIPEFDWHHQPYKRPNDYPEMLIKVKVKTAQEIKKEIYEQLCRENRWSQEDIEAAVSSCRDYRSALEFLLNECPLCYDQYPHSKIMKMIHCNCSVCTQCFIRYFSSIIKEKSIIHVVCPLCNKPELEKNGNSDESMEYFSLLDTQFRHHLDQETHDLFQTKLRDRALMEMPEFRWCSHCPFGILHEMNTRKMNCPTCLKSTCFNCKQKWEDEHEIMNCEEFQLWKKNTQELGEFLSKNGIECPSCKFKFELWKGGCLHFTCTQCKHEFCGGCKKNFYQRQDCDFSEECKGKGLHAHHTRDCFYYLRDWDTKRLQELLQKNGIQYEKYVKEHYSNSLQGNERRENVKEISGDYDASNNAEKELLVQLINTNFLDPMELYTQQEMEIELQRWNIPFPEHSRNDREISYEEKLKMSWGLANSDSKGFNHHFITGVISSLASLNFLFLHNIQLLILNEKLYLKSIIMVPSNSIVYGYGNI